MRFITKNDGILLKVMDFLLQLIDFVPEMMDFVLKHDGFCAKTEGEMRTWLAVIRNAIGSGEYMYTSNYFQADFQTDFSDRSLVFTALNAQPLRSSVSSR